MRVSPSLLCLAAFLLSAAVLSFSAPAVEWQSCDVLTLCIPGRCPTPNPPPYAAECALIDVPLSWRVSTSLNLTMFVKRIFVNGSRPSRHLWMLMGGPGFSGSFLDNYATKVLTDASPDFAVYIPDHRGTGRSSVLPFPPQNCAPQETTSQCVARVYAAYLPYLTVTEASLDVINLIKLLSSTASQRALYGWSYGTYWANRVLTISPKIVDQVILEGTCPSKGCSFASFDINMNLATANYLDACARSNSNCAKYLGAHPDNVAMLAIKQIDNGELPCLAKLTNLSKVSAANLRSFFAFSILFSHSRACIQATLKRLFYCSDSDAIELQNMFDNLYVPDSFELKRGVMENLARPIPPDQMGGVIAASVIMSELAGQDLSKINATDYAIRIMNVDEALIATLGQTKGVAMNIQNGWPLYPRDEYVGVFAPIQVPFLALHGEFDPQCSQGFLLQAQLAWGSSKLFTPVLVPGGIHQSSDDDPDPTQPNCPRSILVQFLNSPKNLDLSCLSSMPPPDFEAVTPASQSFLEYYFGTTSVWGN